MKTIKIGSEEYRLMENLFDINDERFLLFKQKLLQTFENMDNPVFHASYNRFIQHYNSGNHAEGLIEWHNFRKGLELKELDHDAFSFCFSLICLEEGEDQKEMSEDFHAKKIRRMWDNGLTRGFVEEAVENFTKASPRLHGAFSLHLEMMKFSSRVEQSKTSSS